SMHFNNDYINKMMEYEIAENDVITVIWLKFQDVRFEIGNFLVTSTQCPRNLQCSRLSVQGPDLNFRTNFSCIIDNQSRNIARSGSKIDNAHTSIRGDPAAHKVKNKAITAEPAIELPNVFQVALQLGRNRLRPIHHFQNSWIK